MKRTTLQIILGLLLLVGVILIMSFSATEKNEQIVGLPKIHIEVPGEMVFVTKEDIINHLKRNGLINDSLIFENTNIEAVENELKNMQVLENIQVYKTLSGNWFIEAKVREPIARVFTKNATSFYIDKKGAVMPLSSNYTAHVLTFTGDIEQPSVQSAFEIVHNDSLSEASVFDDVYAVASYIWSDKFLNQLITQVEVKNNHEFELIPRIGDFRIFLGKAQDLDQKMENLKILYHQGLNNTGWNAYDSIYLKFEHQIVCSRRE